MQIIEKSEPSRAQYAQLISENKEKYAYCSDSLSIAQLFDFVNMYDKEFSPNPNDGVELFYCDKKEAISLLQGAGLQLSSALPQDGFVHSMPDNGSNVKAKIKNIMEARQFTNWFGGCIVG